MRRGVREVILRSNAAAFRGLANVACRPPLAQGLGGAGAGAGGGQQHVCRIVPAASRPPAAQFFLRTMAAAAAPTSGGEAELLVDRQASAGAAGPRSRVSLSRRRAKSRAPGNRARFALIAVLSPSSFSKTQRPSFASPRRPRSRRPPPRSGCGPGILPTCPRPRPSGRCSGTSPPRFTAECCRRWATIAARRERCALAGRCTRWCARGRLTRGSMLRWTCPSTDSCIASTCSRCTSGCWWRECAWTTRATPSSSCSCCTRRRAPLLLLSLFFCRLVSPRSFFVAAALT